VSSKSKNSSSTKDGAALKHIIKYNCFRNKVLIATKVLDNGVNLIDPIDALKTMPSPEDCKYKYLNHIVISEVEQTQFLQMLGRKRIHKSNRPINLYLRARKLSSIVNYINRFVLPIVKFISSFLWLKHLYFWNGEEYTKGYRAREASDEIDFIKKYTVNGCVSAPYSYYLLLNGSSSYEMPEKARGNPFLITDIFHLNNLVLKKIEYTYYHLMSFVESANNLKNENPLEFSNIEESLWIKEQLSWIGMEYNFDCWIPGSQVSASAQHTAKQRFEELLQLHCRDGRIRTAMNEVQEKEFKQAFLDFISTNYPRSIYAKRKPTPQTINNILRELEYPFKVSSEKRSINGKQRNWWFVEGGYWEPK